MMRPRGYLDLSNDSTIKSVSIGLFHNFPILTGHFFCEVVFVVEGKEGKDNAVGDRRILSDTGASAKLEVIGEGVPWVGGGDFKGGCFSRCHGDLVCRYVREEGPSADVKNGGEDTVDLKVREGSVEQS